MTNIGLNTICSQVDVVLDLFTYIRCPLPFLLLINFICVFAFSLCSLLSSLPPFSFSMPLFSLLSISFLLPPSLLLSPLLSLVSLYPPSLSPLPPDPHFCCQELMAILQDHHFWDLVYPNDSDDTVLDRKKHLIDLYLNMQDKIVREGKKEERCTQRPFVCAEGVGPTEECS